MESVRNLVSSIRKWESELQLSSDLLLIQYVIRRALKAIYYMTKSQNNYWYIFESNVFKYPGNRALVWCKPTGLPGDEGFQLEEFTFQELYDCILKLSEILVHRYGVEPGQCYGILCTNKPLFILLWFAMWNIGATPAFLNYNNRGKPLIHCMKISQLKQVFIDPDCRQGVDDCLDEIKEELPDLTLNFLDEKALMEEVKHPNSIKFRQLNSKRNPTDYDYNTGALIYTSGTTGLPKSAIMSWRKCGVGSSLYGYIVKMDSKATVFTSMPLYHSTASVLGVCAAFNLGTCVALSTKFSTSTIWTQLKLTQATHLQYVGEVCRYLLNSPIHPDERQHMVKVAYGNGLRSDIWKEFKTRFGINAIGEFWAATESPFAVTNYQEGDFAIGACRNYGKLIQFILQFQQTIIKMDPEDNSMEYRDPKTGLCQIAPVGEPGELLMNIFFAKNPKTMFQGYLGNEQETESKILRNVFHKGDAWFRSGDLLKADQDGLWYFVDRLGDTFRWKSENVSATEVEDQILENLGQVVAQTVVVGVKLPNYEGRAGLSIIELKQKDDYNINRVLNNLSHVSLPRYAIPIFLKFVDEIGSSDNHKVPKRLYRDQVLPKGVNNDETIYWLYNGKSYKELTMEDWQDIVNGRAKI